MGAVLGRAVLAHRRRDRREPRGRRPPAARHPVRGPLGRPRDEPARHGAAADRHAPGQRQEREHALRAAGRRPTAGPRRAARDGPASLRLRRPAAAPPTVDLRFEAAATTAPNASARGCAPCRARTPRRRAPAAPGVRHRRARRAAHRRGADRAAAVLRVAAPAQPLDERARRRGRRGRRGADRGAAARGRAAAQARRQQDRRARSARAVRRRGRPAARALSRQQSPPERRRAARRQAAARRRAPRAPVPRQNAVGDEGGARSRKRCARTRRVGSRSSSSTRTFSPRRGCKRCASSSARGRRSSSGSLPTGAHGDFDAPSPSHKQRKVSRKMGVGEELADIFDAARDLERFRANRNQRLLVRGHYWVVRLWDVCVARAVPRERRARIVHARFSACRSRGRTVAFWVTEWCFVLDVALNFSMTYYDEYNEERFDRWDIARNYIFGSQPPWALVDIAALVPFMARGVFGIARGVDALARARSRVEPPARFRRPARALARQALRRRLAHSSDHVAAVVALRVPRGRHLHRCSLPGLLVLPHAARSRGDVPRRRAMPRR